MEIYYVIRVSGSSVNVMSYYSFSRLKKCNPDVGDIEKSHLPVKIGGSVDYILVLDGEVDNRV